MSEIFENESACLSHDFFREININCIRSLQAAAFTSLGVVCVSTFCFILSTFPELQDEEEFKEPENEDVGPLTNFTTPSAFIDLSEMFREPFIELEMIKFFLRAVDWITVFYFCIEYIVRFLCSPSKKKFFFKVRL